MAGILYALTLMIRHQVLGVLPLLGDHTVLYLPAPCPLPVAPHDFGRSGELIERGYALARDFLASGLPLARGGVVGLPHHHGPLEEDAGRTGPAPGSAPRGDACAFPAP